MANRRTLKRDVKYIFSALFAECIATSLYTTKGKNEDIETSLSMIMKLRENYVGRISHVEKGMKAKYYFKDFSEKLNKDMSEIIDQITNWG